MVLARRRATRRTAGVAARAAEEVEAVVARLRLVRPVVGAAAALAEGLADAASGARRRIGQAQLAVAATTGRPSGSAFVACVVVAF